MRLKNVAYSLLLLTVLAGLIGPGAFAAYNGSGTFLRVHDWTADEANNIDIQADRMDEEFDGIATGLSTAITKDGQTTITADIPFSSNKITGLGDATANTDAVNAGQVQDGEFIWAGTAGGTADVITLTVTPTVTAYASGQTFRFVSSGANTTNVTVNVSGLGAKALTKDGTAALVAGDLISGAVYQIVYDGTQFQLSTDLPLADDEVDTEHLATGAVVSIDENLALPGDISPAQLTADVNDYSPTGLSTATVLRLSADAVREITGIAGGADGRVLVLHNIGTNTINLANESVSSAAANRFDLNVTSSLSIRQDRTVVLIYDATASRWRAFARPESTATTSNIGVVEEATEAEMESETADVVPTADIVKHSPGVAKAWVNFTGVSTVTIRDSYNVDSITDNGTGNYTVVFTTDFADTNYACVASGTRAEPSEANGSFAPQVGTRLAGSVVIATYTGSTARADWESVYVACYGAQ